MTIVTKFKMSFGINKKNKEIKMWQVMLLNLGINLVKSYIENSDSKQDDKVLSVVKDGAKYLSKKDNNDVTVDIADTIVKAVMK